MAHPQSVREAFAAPSIDHHFLARQPVDPAEPLMPICSFEPKDYVQDPNAPTRTIFRRPLDGKLIFVECDGSDVTQVGMGVTYVEARELALAVLGDEVTAKELTLTSALQMLSIAFLASQAAVERSNQPLPAAARGA